MQCAVRCLSESCCEVEVCPPGGVDARVCVLSMRRISHNNGASHMSDESPRAACKGVCPAQGQGSVSV